MLFLKLVIAHLAGVKTQFTDNLVRLMQIVGLARQEHTQLHGNNLSVQDTKLQLVQSKPKRKPKVAQADTTEQLPKQTRKVALAVLGQGGLQRVILASQPVSQSLKPKRSVAQPTIQVQSPKQTRKPVLTTNGKDGSQQATPASKTRQRAKAVPTQKTKAVASTTAVKKRTPSKTPAKTRTARQSKVRGA